MPERRRIPEDNEPQPNKSKQDDKQSTQPFLPPELPEKDATRQQTVQDETRYMTPVKDTRFNPSQPVKPEEKPKRDSAPIVPSPVQRQGPYPTNSVIEKPKRGQPPQSYTPVRRIERPNRNSPFRLPVWSVLLMLMLVAGSTACVVLVILGLGGRNAPTAPPEFVVVSAVPSSLPEVTIPSLLATPTLPQQFQQPADTSFVLSGPTLAPIVYTATPTQPPQITVGSTVVIVGDQGINIRNNPGMSNTPVLIAKPGDQYKITDGPRQSDGLNWWQLGDQSGQAIGWAAENDGTTDLFQVVTP